MAVLLANDISDLTTSKYFNFTACEIEENFFMLSTIRRFNFIHFIVLNKK